jgi:hypothetical protein
VAFLWLFGGRHVADNPAVIPLFRRCWSRCFSEPESIDFSDLAADLGFRKIFPLPVRNTAPLAAAA